MVEPSEAMRGSDFAEWLERCGVSLSEAELDRLAKAGVIRPTSGGYVGAHVLVAARYDAAVRVPRHAWATEQELSVDLGPVERVMGCVERALSGDEGAKEELTREFERELARRDPFGPIAHVVDVLRADVVEKLRGEGRLYVELHRVASRLAEELEAAAPSSEEATAEPDPVTGPVTGPASDPMAFGEDEDVLDALSEIVGEDGEDGEELLLIEESEGSDEKLLLVEESEGSDEELLLVDEAEALEESEESMLRVSEADEAVSVPPPMPSEALKRSSSVQDNPFMRGEVRATAKTESLKSRLEALKKPADVEFSALMDESPIGDGPGDSEDDWVEQETVAMDPSDFEEGLAEMTQEATQSHMDERLSLERRIEQLNARRQEFLTAHNWAELVSLYEDGLELFDGEERAQVLLTVVKLYAAKLGDPDRGVPYLGKAWAMRGEAPSGRNALKLAEQLASRGNAPALAWLESVREDGDAETHEAWVRALSASGERERALLTWGAYMAEEGARTSRRTLKTLETLSVGAQEEIVEGLYEDLLEQAGEKRRGVVSVSAAKVAKERGDDVAWTAHLEGALEAGEDVWEQYAEVCRRLELRGAWESARERWGGGFEGKESWPEGPGEPGAGEASDEAIALWEARVERSAGDWRAVSLLSSLYEVSGRWPERYALLNRSASQVTSDEDRVEVYLSMARIAVEYLEAPDEAAIHYARVIEIVPDHPEAHEGLQSLGA